MCSARHRSLQLALCFRSLYLRMKKLCYMLSYIRQDVHTFLFSFLRQPCGHSSHCLHQLSFKLNTNSLFLWKRAQPFLSGRFPFFQGTVPWHTIFTLSCVTQLLDSAPVHSPSGKELNPSS